ncbi:MAG: alanine racemase [Ruminococcaceae bacterium]|nr:alanine racemase [Oscillospiraceae bacterium]
METRTWAEINLDALSENIRAIRNLVKKSTKILAVVKADAYGHGVLESAKTLLENGADYLGVASLDEGIQLRRHGISAPILILGAIEKHCAETVVCEDLIPAVFDSEMARAISEAAQRIGTLAKIHIKVDTGMSRIGFVAGVDDDAVSKEILEISKMPGILIEGIFSHFATADEADDSYMRLQLSRFLKICTMLEENGLEIPIRHIANSGAIMMYPETHLDMVRAGIILYGLYPSSEVDRSRLDLKPVMAVKSRITMIKELEENRGVSYGKVYITSQNTRVATVPIGYADGYTRTLSGRAQMIAKNKKVPVIGRICMDQCMIDVTNVHTISTGDEVIIFGADTVTADDLAEWIGTINYEIVCLIAKRIPRVYLKNGKAVTTLNYLEKL